MKTFFINLYLLFKTKSMLLLQVLTAFLLPIKPLIILVGLMILIDTITGIWKAKKTGETFTSKKLSSVISKMVLYQAGLILFFVLEKYMLSEFVQLFISMPFFLTKIVAVFFCSVEIVSVNENVKAIYGINLFEMFKSIVSRIKNTKDSITAIADDNAVIKDN
jgi:hypothetical protein